MPADLDQAAIDVLQRGVDAGTVKLPKGARIGDVNWRAYKLTRREDVKSTKLADAWRAINPGVHVTTTWSDESAVINPSSRWLISWRATDVTNRAKPIIYNHGVAIVNGFLYDSNDWPHTTPIRTWRDLRNYYEGEDATFRILLRRGTEALNKARYPTILEKWRVLGAVEVKNYRPPAGERVHAADNRVNSTHIGSGYKQRHRAIRADTRYGGRLKEED